MTAIAVRTVRVHQRGPGPSPRRAAESLIGAMVPAAADHRVLIVRHLVLPGWRPDTGRDRLAQAWRTAVRPAASARSAGGVGIDPAAEAVWFADEIEALACLSADLVAGVAGTHWYWRSRLARTGDRPMAQIWLRELRWLPRAVALIDQWSRGGAARTIAALTPAEATLVTAAVLPEMTTTWLHPSQAPSAAAPVASTAMADPEVVARWSRLLPPTLSSLAPAQHTLLAALSALASSPGASRAAVREWAHAAGQTARLAAVSRESSTALWGQSSIGAPDLQLVGHRPTDVADGPAQSAPGQTDDRAPHSADVPAAVAKRPAAPLDHPRADPMITTARSAGLPDSRVCEAVPDPSTSTRGEPDLPAYRRPSSPSREVWSQYAPVFYLLHLLCRFAGPEFGWLNLAGFARRVLRGRPHARRRARDPIWALLAGLADDERAYERRAQSWEAPARAHLGEVGVDGTRFEQAGQILLTRTHLDVVLRLDQIDLAVRRSGLDQDLGWVPSLGRVIAFHFEDSR